MGFGIFGSLLHCISVERHWAMKAFLRCLKVSCSSKHFWNEYLALPSLKLTSRTWKWMFPFGMAYFQGLLLLVSVGVCLQTIQPVSHLLPCLIAETEAGPQTGDGGELVEGLPSGCLGFKTMPSIESSLKNHSFMVLFPRFFSNVKIVFSEDSTSPPKNLTMSSGMFEVLLLALRRAKRRGSPSMTARGKMRRSWHPFISCYKHLIGWKLV